MGKATEKTILVYLNIAGDPQVEVDRDVRGRSKMQWRKEDAAQDFVFNNIDFDPSQPFVITTKKNDRIDVKNSEAIGQYTYTLTVEDSAGNLYNTTEKGAGPAAGDKPVIRN